MCGIVGYLRKTEQGAPVGATLLTMLNALGCRGPDSAGVAVYRKPKGNELVARVKVGEGAPGPKAVRAMLARLRKVATVGKAKVEGELVRVSLRSKRTAVEITAAIEADPGTEVVSLGSRLEIMKQVGAPDALDRAYHLAGIEGTHGIGHTRLSTESRIDLSHSQPFWAHGRPDVATAHNGHITNYHALRRRYEQAGVRFYTDNDSELLGLYLADRLDRGDPLPAALERSVRELDGSFSYLVATDTLLGYVKDRFALKPLVVGSGDGFVAIATEEVAIRAAFPDIRAAVEPAAKSVRLWSLPR